MREERGSPEKGGTERGGGRGVPRGGDARLPQLPLLRCCRWAVKCQDRESFVLCVVWAGP
jgi:hypothetical protein